MASELHRTFINQMISNQVQIKDKKVTFSEEITLKLISGIYLDKIKYFINKEYPLFAIAYLFFLNKYGKLQNIAENKYIQVLLLFL